MFYKNWTSTFSFLIMGVALAISIYDKRKRMEVIVLISFVIGTLLFFSSSYVAGSTSPDIKERYMISSFLLSMMLFAFIMRRVLTINFINLRHSKIIKVLKGSKVVFFFILILFLITSFYYSTPGQASLMGKSAFNDPSLYASYYPINKEGMSDKRIIIDSSGRKAVEYNAIPFTPVIPKSGNYDPVKIDPDVKTLKEIMKKGYDVYTLKDHRYGDAPYFRYLEANHGLFLKDFSLSFCKMEISDKTTQHDVEIKSDSLCYGGFGKFTNSSSGQ